MTKGSGNDCGVDVASEVHFGSPVTTLRWVITPTLGQTTQFRFKGSTGIVIADNDNGSGTPVFVRNGGDSTSTDDLYGTTYVAKTFAYTIYLQWQPPGTDGWTDCTPLDPRIINEGPP